MENKYAGLWIDHKQTIIVFLIDGRITVSRLESNIKGRFRLSGGSRSALPYGPQEISSEQKKDKRYLQHIRKYYTQVVHALEDTDGIFIFGPGEAKRELEKEIKKSKQLSAKLKRIENADKMTENQIVTKVKKFFNVTY